MCIIFIKTIVLREIRNVRLIRFIVLIKDVYQVSLEVIGKRDIN